MHLDAYTCNLDGLCHCVWTWQFSDQMNEWMKLHAQLSRWLPKKGPCKLHLLHFFPKEKFQLKCLACSLRKNIKARLDIFVSFFTASAITHSKGLHDTTRVKSDLTKFVCACHPCRDINCKGWNRQWFLRTSAFTGKLGITARMCLSGDLACSAFKVCLDFTPIML
jgi:hypothetical protein